MNKLVVAVLALVFSLYGVSADAQIPGLDKLKKLKEKTGLGIEEVKTATLGYSEEQERVIGERVAGNILGAAPLLDVPEIQEYVNLTGRWLAMNSGRPDLDWVFAVIDDPGINAFAAPGGLIVLTRGLYSMLSTESELAAVLAHEIIHVVEKHHLSLLRKGAAISAGGRFAGSRLSGRAGPADSAVQNLIGNGAELMARGLDRSAEFTCDERGIELMTKSGYSPIGMYELMFVLEETSGNAGADSMQLLLSTHPSPSDRLDRLEELVTPELEQEFSKFEGRSRFRPISTAE